jgi:hypothetical protein
MANDGFLSGDSNKAWQSHGEGRKKQSLTRIRLAGWGAGSSVLRDANPVRRRQTSVSEAATSGHEVEDQDYHRDDQQNVNQAAGNMKAETQ